MRARILRAYQDYIAGFIPNTRSDYYAEMACIGYAKRRGYKGLEEECRVGMGISRSMIREYGLTIAACACLLGHGPMPTFEPWMIENLKMDTQKTPSQWEHKKIAKILQFQRIVARLILRAIKKTL